MTRTRIELDRASPARYPPIPAGNDGDELTIVVVGDIDEVTVTVASVRPHPSSYVFTDRGQSLTFAMRGGGWWLTEMTQAGHMRGGN